MFKLFKFLGLISKALLMQFTHVFGYVAIVIAIAAGYYRLPSWVAPVLGIALGVGANYLTDVSDVREMLATVKASDGSGRTLDQGEGGFLTFVYLVIGIVGYIIGGWSRIQRNQRSSAKAGAEPPKEG